MASASAADPEVRHDDPRWADSGAPDVETYGRWRGHMCGVARLCMARLSFGY